MENNSSFANPVGSAPVKVLVVDDSAFMRYTITQHLSKNPAIQVLGAAHDGREALEMIPRLQPDVITLDVEMPGLDGLSTLKEIMADFPRPVIMLSSLTQEGALETIQALTFGAVDFVPKPSQKANIASVMDDVSTKVLKAARVRVRQVPKNMQVSQKVEPVTQKKNIRPLSRQDRVVMIGASTGGPRALNTVVPAIPGNLPAAYAIVQHMPAGFTRSLAERLDSLSNIRVKEAEPGDTLQVGLALLAPGGFHMVFNERGEVTLNQNPPVHGVRPSVDVTMTSLITRYAPNMVGVVLTGMGSDGATGSTLLHGAGGYVIAEDESTCVVWGMPRSVVEAGAADEVAPLTDVANSIERAILRMKP